MTAGMRHGASHDRYCPSANRFHTVCKGCTHLKGVIFGALFPWCYRTDYVRAAREAQYVQKHTVSDKP